MAVHTIDDPVGTMLRDRLDSIEEQLAAEKEPARPNRVVLTTGEAIIYLPKPVSRPDDQK